MRDVYLKPGWTTEKDVVLTNTARNSGIDVYLSPGWVVEKDLRLLTNRYFPGLAESVVEPPEPPSGLIVRMLMGVGL